MNRRREKTERNDRIAQAETAAMRAQAVVSKLVADNTILKVQNDALQAALIKKAVVTLADIDAQKPKPVIIAVKP